MTSYGCERCGGSGLSFEAFVAHAFGHLNERLDHMSDDIAGLAADEAAEAASIDAFARVTADFLADIDGRLAALGNGSDQLNAIRADVQARKAQVDALVASVTAEKAKVDATDAPAAPETPVAGDEGDAAAPAADGTATE